MRFEAGDSKDEVLLFRADCYERLSAYVPEASRTVLSAPKDTSKGRAEESVAAEGTADDTSSKDSKVLPKRPKAVTVEPGEAPADDEERTERKEKKERKERNERKEKKEKKTQGSRWPGGRRVGGCQ